MRVAASADLLFTCGPLMRHLFDAVPAAMRGAHAAELARRWRPWSLPPLRAGDAVLVKGSLGSGMKRVVEAIDAAASRTAPATAAGAG